MIFSFSAFAAFLLISYYATTTTKEVTPYRNSFLVSHRTREIGKVIDQKSANGNCPQPNYFKIIDFPHILDANFSQSRAEIESISNIIFKGIVSPAGGVNLTYVNYLVNQSQVEMGVVKCKPQSLC